MSPTDAPRKRSRQVKRVFIVAVVLIVGTFLSLPWLASTALARWWLVSSANGVLAPSRIEASSLGFSWSGPQEIRGLVLRNKAGKVLVSIPRVRVGRSLLGLAWERPLRTSVVLEGAAVAIERRADGSIDLLDALAPLWNEDPRKLPPKEIVSTEIEMRPAPGPDLDVKIIKGTLELRSPELPEPITARQFDMAAHLPSSKGPITWRMTLAQPAEGDDSSLELAGELEQPADASTSAGLVSTLSARRWPWGLSEQGFTTRGRLDGKFSVRRSADQWSVSGDGQVLGLEASGPSLAGDRLRIDRTTLACEAAMAAGAWDVRRLDISCPLGWLKALGKGSVASPAQVSSRIEGRLDLAALARQLPHAMRIREGLSVQEGEATVRLDLKNDPAKGSSEIVVDGRLSDVLARDAGRAVALRNPASFSAQVVRKGGDVQVQRLDLKTGFLNASGRGDLERGVTVSATIDLAGLKSQLQDVIEFNGLDIAGQGRLGADYRRGAGGTYVARFAAELKSPRVSGLTAEPITRKALRLDIAGSGPVGDSGLPLTWNQAKLTLATDDLKAGTKLSTTATAEPILIEELHLEIPMRTAEQATSTATETIRFAAAGRFDSTRGVLELRPLPGDHPPEPLALGAEGMTVQGLKPEGEIHISSVLTGDLARLDRALAWWTGDPPMDLAGAMSFKSGIVFHKGGETTIASAFESPDLTLPGSAGAARRLLGPVAIPASASRSATADRVDFKNIAMACRYASVHATGSLVQPAGRRVVELQGKVVPNWATIDQLVVQSLEPGARVRGEVRPFRVHGPVPAGGLVAILQGLDAELGLDRFEAVAFGVKVAPTPVVLHWRGKKGAFEPIETTVNNGRASLRPDLLIDDTGTLTLRVAEGSSVRQAEINEEVSHSLLSYVAPVLRDATKVQGKVSMNVSRAEFPLVGDPSRHTTLIGRIEFDDVVFTAGKFANELVSLTGKRGEASVRLQQPVELTIADGRVNQKGLAVPIGRDTRIELEGSVGFDQTLAMRARMPIPRGALGNRADVAELVEALRVGLPIGGTLSRPTIDRRALRVGLGEAGRSVLERGAADLLRGLSRPRDSQPGRTPR